MEKNLQLSNLVDCGLTDIQLSPKYHHLEIKGLTCDSRTIKHGFLFAAFPGEQVDGRKFIDQAIAAGATAILTTPGVSVEQDVAVITHEHPRLVFSKIAARFHHQQPKTIVAVTGTNGKTSVAHFCHQLWHLLGQKSAAIGTMGNTAMKETKTQTLTTPDPVTLHQTLKEMADQDYQHVALEASSHGLSQYRLDGVQLEAAAFTNLSRDHLDYHQTMDSYFQAKAQLFNRLLAPGKTAILNADVPEFEALQTICQKRDQKIITYGKQASDLQLKACDPNESGYRVALSVFGKDIELQINLVGAFQIDNLLCALGLLIASGSDTDACLKLIEQITPVAGRMELAAKHNHAGIFVDYAHTPDALSTAIEALRPHTKGNLWVIFGCGGNRDKGKRPEMGKVACEKADHIVVTDDNPRNEDPTTIRQEILAACEKAEEIGDRANAIRHVMDQLHSGDTLLIAGKGHEKYQIIGDETHPFDDIEIVREYQHDT